MKKISILLFAIMMVSSLSAQIDSFDDSDNFVTGSKSKPTFNKLPFLSPYEGELFLYSYNTKWNAILKQWSTIDNIIGEQVFYIGSHDRVITKRNQEIESSDIPHATYYTVKDILITQEEVDSLKRELTNYASQGKGTVFLDQICHTKFQPEEWFRKDKDNRGGEVKYWMYILKDSNDVEYYIPITNDRYRDSMRKSFIVVKGFLLLKQKFENQRVLGHEGVKLCKKIAYKDGRIQAAMTDTLSTSVSYVPIDEFAKKPYSYSNKKDSLYYITYWCPGDCVESYTTLREIDSIKNKNAYEEHLAEIEKAKKKETRKQELIKKYGQKFGTSIFNKEACVGMTKAMCKEAIGSPDQVTQSQTSSGNVEVWSYTLAYQMWNGLAPIIVVTFTNDRVTAVDKYTSWPF